MPAASRRAPLQGPLAHRRPPPFSLPPVPPLPAPRPSPLGQVSVVMETAVNKKSTAKAQAPLAIGALAPPPPVLLGRSAAAPVHVRPCSHPILPLPLSTSPDAGFAVFCAHAVLLPIDGERVGEGPCCTLHGSFAPPPRLPRPLAHCRRAPALPLRPSAQAAASTPPGLWAPRLSRTRGRVTSGKLTALTRAGAASRQRAGPLPAAERRPPTADRFLLPLAPLFLL